MVNKTSGLTAIAVALTIGAATPAGAATFNLGADWSDVANPNGAWTYLVEGAPFAHTVADWSGFGVAWADSSSSGFGFTPMALKYDGVGSESIDALAGDIVVHTNTVDGNQGVGDLSLRFTSPNAGIADVTGKVWDAHTSVDRDQHWEIYLNGSLQDSGTVLGDGTEGRDHADQFQLAALNLGAGDMLELRLVNAFGSNGGLLGVDFSVDLTAVPIPASLPMFVTALAAGMVRQRRRR